MMTTKEQKLRETVEIVSRLLRNKITESHNMWKNEEASPAFIVGYLEGTIKAVADALDEALEN